MTEVNTCKKCKEDAHITASKCWDGNTQKWFVKFECSNPLCNNYSTASDDSFSFAFDKANSGF